MRSTILSVDLMLYLLIEIEFNIFTHYLGRIAGIEPASSPWQREILPFDHIRNILIIIIY